MTQSASHWGPSSEASAGGGTVVRRITQATFGGHSWPQLAGFLAGTAGRPRPTNLCAPSLLQGCVAELVALPLSLQPLCSSGHSSTRLLRLAERWPQAATTAGGEEGRPVPSIEGRHWGVGQGRGRDAEWSQAGCSHQPTLGPVA